MLLRNEDNIREVIAFPMNGNAQDLMCGAPGEVTEQQLREVHIKVRDQCGKNRKGMEISMVNVISDETREELGILAKLELSDEEKEAAKKEMGRMLDYIDKLGELDTTGVEPMSHVFPVQNVFREDVVNNGDESEQTLVNAPGEKDNMFVVPKTFD